MVSLWSLIDSKSPQVSRTLLSILADLNNTVVWMVSTRPLISKSTSPCTSLLLTVSRASITIGITVTFMFNSFFNSLAKSGYLFLFSLSFNFILSSAETAKSTIRQVLVFCWLLLGLVVWPRSVCISKSQRSLCVSFSRTDSGLCIYHLFVWSNLNFLHNSRWINLPTQLRLVLYFFCANLLHSLTIWVIVSSLLPNDLHLLFYYVLSILALIWLVLMVLIWGAIRRDSFSLVRFPFLRHVHVFLREMSLVSPLKRP